VERRKAPRLEEWRARGRSTRRAAAAGAIRMGRTLGAALTRRREVGPAEAINLFWSSLLFLAVGVLAFALPKAISIPFGVLAVWWAVAGLFQSWRLYRRELTEKAEDARHPPDSGERYRA
jgi:cardiolipin synthase